MRVQTPAERTPNGVGRLLAGALVVVADRDGGIDGGTDGLTVDLLVVLVFAVDGVDARDLDALPPVGGEIVRVRGGVFADGHAVRGSHVDPVGVVVAGGTVFPGVGLDGRVGALLLRHAAVAETIPQLDHVVDGHGEVVWAVHGDVGLDPVGIGPTVVANRFPDVLEVARRDGHEAARDVVFFPGIWGDDDGGDLDDGGCIVEQAASG